MRVCLGVVDVPYGYGDNPEATTGEVAQELENNYQLFTHFQEMHMDVIRKDAGEALALALINHIKYGVPLASDGEQLSETMREFHLFLELEEMAGLGVEGVPTQAALQGKNSRLKREYGDRRPSFIDGGLFKANFIAWIENDAES